MVAYHYPPSGAVAALRPHKFARHLPESGWEPFVVARRPDPLQPRDASFVADGPAPRIEIDPFEPARLLGFLPASWSAALRRRLCFPDEEVGWRKGLRRLLPGLIRDLKPDLLWANSVPLGSLTAAADAAADAGVPWVADFHNEWTRNPYFRPPNRRTEGAHRCAEERVVSAARAVVTLNPLHSGDLRERFPGALVETIENGFDPGDLEVGPARPERRPLVFTYAGAVYGAQGPGPFLRALVGSGLRDVEVRIVGDRFGAGVPGSWPFPVSVAGHLPHRELGRVFSETSAFFLCLEASAARQLPAKLYEYLGAGRPTFAIVPRDGAAAAWIGRTGSGTAVPVEEPERWAGALRDFVGALGSYRAPAGEEFHRRAQARRLAGILDRVKGSA
jgi:hypothetical protein